MQQRPIVHLINHKSQQCDRRPRHRTDGAWYLLGVLKQDFMDPMRYLIVLTRSFISSLLSNIGGCIFPSFHRDSILSISHSQRHRVPGDTLFSTPHCYTSRGKNCFLFLFSVSFLLTSNHHHKFECCKSLMISCYSKLVFIISDILYGRLKGITGIFSFFLQGDWL